MEKQFKMLKIIMRFHELGMDALKRGASMKDVFALPVRERIARMRYLEEKEIKQIDQIEDTIKSEMDDLVSAGVDTDVVA
jgi:V/A-type H+-transporting ATPase subunit A